MKDLIKKKTQSKGGWKDDVIYCYPANNNIEYNIITAPKSIKLSEILGKLNDNEWKDFQATKQDNIISIDNNNNFRQYFNIDKGRITEISEEMQTNEYKWLYALWVADSEIIDDLEDKE